MAQKGGSKPRKFEEEDFFGSELKPKSQQLFSKPLVSDTVRKSTPSKQTFESLLNETTPKNPDSAKQLGKSQEFDKSQIKASPLSVSKSQSNEGFTTAFSQSPSIALSKNAHAENSKSNESHKREQSNSQSAEINNFSQPPQHNSSLKQTEGRADEQERLIKELKGEIDKLNKESKRKSEQNENQIRKLEEKLKAATEQGAAGGSEEKKAKISAIISEVLQEELINLQSVFQEAFKFTIDSNIESFHELNQDKSKKRQFFDEHEAEIEKQLKFLQSEFEKKIEQKALHESEQGERAQEKEESLQETIEGLNQQLGKETDKRADLEQVLENLKADYDSLKRNFEKLKGEKNNLTKSLEAANTEKDETSQALRLKQEELNSLASGKGKAQGASDSSVEVNKLNKAIDDLNKRLKAAEAEKDSTVSDYTEALVKKEEELEDAKATLEDYKELVKNKEVLIRDLEKRVEQKGKQTGGDSSELQQEIEALKKAVKDSEHQVSLAFKNNFIKKMNKLNEVTKNYNFESALSKKLQSQDKVAVSAFFEAFDSVIDEFITSFKKSNAENKSVDARGEAKLKELQEIVQNLTEERQMLSEELKLKDAEIHELQNQIQILQDQEQNRLDHVARLQEDANIIPELSMELENHKLRIDELETQLQTKDYEVETLQRGLTDMQSLLEESQQASELLLKRTDFEIKKIRNEYEEANRKIESLESFREKYDSSQKEISDQEIYIKELEGTIATLEQETKTLKSESAALEKKFKNDSIYKENLVDKRVIGKFLVNYVDMNTAYQTKLQILETLSSILSFSEEDRKKMGLHREGLKIELEKEKEKDKGRRKSSETKVPSKVMLDTSKAEEEKLDSVDTPTPTKSESSAKFKDKLLNFLLEDEM